MTAELTASTKEAISFLRSWHPNDTWVLSAIHPELGFIKTRGFDPHEYREAAKWVADWQGKRNLHFHVNPDIRAASDATTKSRKEHVMAAVSVHVDVDHGDHVLARLEFEYPDSIPGPPTAIIASGGGWQAFWRLRTPVAIQGDVAARAAVERANSGVSRVLGGDKCFTVDHLMRLPGTINLPNPKKRAAGRVPVVARLWGYWPERVYDLEDFPVGDADRSGERHAYEIEEYAAEPTTLNELNRDGVPQRLRLLIKRGRLKDETASDRSAHVCSVVVGLTRRGVPREQILDILLNPEYGISESILEKPDPDAEARRQIARIAAMLKQDDDFPDDLEDM